MFLNYHVLEDQLIVTVDHYSDCTIVGNYLDFEYR